MAIDADSSIYRPPLTKLVENVAKNCSDVDKIMASANHYLKINVNFVLVLAVLCPRMLPS